MQSCHQNNYNDTPMTKPDTPIQSQVHVNHLRNCSTITWLSPLAQSVKTITIHLGPEVRVTRLGHTHWIQVHVNQIIIIIGTINFSHSHLQSPPIWVSSPRNYDKLLMTWTPPNMVTGTIISLDYIRYHHNLGNSFTWSFMKHLKDISYISNFLLE